MKQSGIERRFESIESRLKKLEQLNEPYTERPFGPTSAEQISDIPMIIAMGNALEEKKKEPIDDLDIPYPSGHNWEGLTPRQVEAYNRQEAKKDKGEVQNDSLSGATNLEQGKTMNTEQMPAKEDNQPQADLNPQKQVKQVPRDNFSESEASPDNVGIIKKKGRPKHEEIK